MHLFPIYLDDTSQDKKEDAIDNYYKNIPLYNFSLQLTTSCKQGCSGCYQDHTKNSMSRGTALKQLQDFFMERDRTKIYRPFKITFFGGEPFYEFGLMKEIISFVNYYKPLGFKKFYIPTSGVPGKNIDFLDLIVDLDHSFGQYPIEISISHDGTINNYQRNEPAKKITDLIIQLKNYITNNPNSIIKSSPILSTVVPQNITEDYFIDNYVYFKDNLNVLCNFKLPYILDKKSNLYTNPEIFKKSVHKFLVKASKENIYPFPTLFQDVFELITKGHDEDWCKAGEDSRTILPSGKVTDCDIIFSQKANKLKKAMDEKCKDCSNNGICKKPCLITMYDQENFNGHCLLRKILSNEMIKFINQISIYQKKEI